jgi:hypothetical protein
MEDRSVRTFPEGGGDTTRQVTGYYREYVKAYVRKHAVLSMF